MVLAATIRLSEDVAGLVAGSGPAHAVDLLCRQNEVWTWFSGAPVYGVLKNAAYPPATYLELWPLLSWSSPATVRWLWALLSIPLLVITIVLLWRIAGATTWIWRTLIALAVLSGQGLATGIGVGQMTLLALTPLLGALALLERPERSWSRDLAIAALFLVALIKPSLTAPFFWLVLVAPGGWRPTVIIVPAYLALTIIAASFQEAGIQSVLADWLAWSKVASNHGAGTLGYSSSTSWLVAIGLGEHTQTVSLLCLAAAGIWTYRHRSADPLLLVGALAIFARLWTYHASYDDLVVAVAMVALLRSALASTTGRSMTWAAATLLVAAWAVSLAPAQWLRAEPPLNWIYSAGLSVVWLVMLGYFLMEAHRKRLRLVSREVRDRS